MASVDWKKIKAPQEVKRIMFHNDREKRLQSNHANDNINIALTDYNLQTCNYETACKKYDERIAYLDSLEGANKRKDRVTAISLVIPIPHEIPNEKVGEFTNKVNGILTKQFGVKNMIVCNVHVDEIHDYIDSNKKTMRTSMRHIHDIVIPEINDKLNGKAVCSKQHMIELNNAVDIMCKKDYGVQFLTGEKTKSKDSVESLKLKSKALELEQRETNVENREEAVAYRERHVEKREKAVAQREIDVESYDRVTHRRREEADRKLSEANAKEQDVARREAVVSQLERDMVIGQAKLQNKANELEEREEKIKEREHLLNRAEQADETYREFKRVSQSHREIPDFDDDE